jgi:hypothetical protein
MRAFSHPVKGMGSSRAAERACSAWSARCCVLRREIMRACTCAHGTWRHMATPDFFFFFKISTCEKAVPPSAASAADASTPGCATAHRRACELRTRSGFSLGYLAAMCVFLLAPLEEGRRRRWRRRRRWSPRGPYRCVQQSARSWRVDLGVECQLLQHRCSTWWRDIAALWRAPLLPPDRQLRARARR